MLRLALMYQLRCHGAKLTPGEAQVIESLLKLIDKFQLQADTVVSRRWDWGVSGNGSVGESVWGRAPWNV